MDAELLTRVHQLETARANELHAHGTELQRLERELASRREQEQHLQRLVASLRADKCCADAQVQMLQRKWEQQQETDAKIRADLTRSSALLERENADLRQKNVAVTTAQAELQAQSAVLQAQVQILQQENALLLARREESHAATAMQTLEINRLSTLAAAKQQEVDSGMQRVQMLTEELAQVRERLDSSQLQIKTLERQVDRALQTRNRVLSWRQKQLLAWSSALQQHEAFVRWRTQAVRSKRLVVADMEERWTFKTQQLGRVESKLRVKFAQMRAECAASGSWLRLQTEAMQLASAEVMNGQMPQLLERVQRIQERYAMTLTDKEQAMHKAIETIEQRRCQQRQQQRAMYEWMRDLRRRALRNQAFQGWKEVHLRTVIAQTTHAAMVQAQKDSAQPAAVVVRYPVAGEPILPRDNVWKRWRHVNPIGVSERKELWTAELLRSPRATDQTSCPSMLPSTAESHCDAGSMDRTGSPTRSGHVPLFDSPSKHGVHHTIATFTPTERRFQWQNSTSSTDALYKLPTCIGTGPKKGFGTSTREDWDILTKKNTNACSGPGSYESIGSCGKQPSAVLRSAATTAFENAPRTPLQGDSTPSPGPVYDLPLAIGTAPSTKFALAKRQPLAPANIGPGPNIALKGSFKECRAPSVSPTFGTERRLRANASSSASAPGPIYELEPTGFRTGTTKSFSHAKRF